MSRTTVVVFDLAFLALAPLLALVLRDDIAVEPDKLIGLLPYVLVTFVVALPVYKTLGLDQTLWHYASVSDYARIALAVGLIITGATVAMFLFNRLHSISRSIPVLQALISVFVLVTTKLLLCSLSRQSRSPQSLKSMATGDPPQVDTLIVIGLNHLTRLLLEAIDEKVNSKVHIAGIIALNRVDAGRKLNGHDIFGPDDDLWSIVREMSVHGLHVDRILITAPREAMPERLRDAVREMAETKGVQVEDLDHTLRLFQSPVSQQADHRLPATASGPPQKFAFTSKQIELIANRKFWRIKRALDVVLAALLLVLLAPVWLALIVLVQLTLGSPVYFWQMRPGLNGRPFKLIKFRSLTDAHDARGRPIDITDRLGSVGRFLRSTRLDELPQLWNILIGEMSFIGPRPLLLVDQTTWAHLRHLVRPGLTGYAQVMGGRDVAAADKMALDIWYVANASLALDLQIIARTVPMILFGEHVNREAIRNAWSELGNVESHIRSTDMPCSLVAAQELSRQSVGNPSEFEQYADHAPKYPPRNLPRTTLFKAQRPAGIQARSDAGPGVSSVLTPRAANQAIAPIDE
ncbi:MAG: sugar transferase [Hyphomicrobiaceae bacterium]